MSRSLVVLFSISLILTNFALAIADETSETSFGIMVEDAVVEPAGKGETTKLRFKVSNYTTQRIWLSAVRTPISKSATMTMRLDAESFEPINVVHILREETLDLRSSHIRIELNSLRQEVRLGMKVDFELVFNDRVVPATADVH